VSFSHQNILSILECVKVDRFSVACYFKSNESHRSVVSVVPFEPYDGEIVITWKDMLLHPIQSYNRYYHTPITIYGDDSRETIVMKAFLKVSEHFSWDAKLQRFKQN